MPLREPTDFSQRFYRQLEQTRASIETLPEEWRPYFRSLVGQTEEHHRTMEQNCVKVRELVDDMRLNEASVKFDLWCAAQNLERTFASGRASGTRGSRDRVSLGDLPPKAPVDPDVRR